MSGTAVIYPQSILTPGKVELLKGWLPQQPWFTGPDAEDAERVAAFRFADPAGEVGIETLIVKSHGVTYQVPLTYRETPLVGAADYLVGTMSHSILGPRWVYDASGDPVYVAEVLRVIREADTEAAIYADGVPNPVKTAQAQGSGVSGADTGSWRIIRLPDGQHLPSDPPLGTLNATWTDDESEHTEIFVTLN